MFRLLILFLISPFLTFAQCLDFNFSTTGTNATLLFNDVLGREKGQIGFMLEIYNDGSVEKKYLIK